MTPGELRRSMGTWPWFVATAGGLGHMWPASGTWGSLPPAVLFALMSGVEAPVWLQLAVQVALALAACRGCALHGGQVERFVGRKDPGVVVVDEVAGMALTLALALAGLLVMQSISAGAPSWAASMARALPTSLALATAAGSFFWFRVMDVIKPPPARGLQSLEGGLGVLIDDVVVAPYAAIAFLVSLAIWMRLQPVGG